MSYQPPSQPEQQPQWGQPSQPLPPQQGYPQQPQWQEQPGYPQQPQYPQQQPQQQPGAFQQPPQKTRKPIGKGTKIGCGVVTAVVILVIIIAAAASGGGSKGNATPTATQPVAQNNPTHAPTAKPTPQSIHYPPKTLADLRGLAAKGDASAIHEFHSESVGLTGVCPQPKREVTVSPSVTGQQLAEDLLAYFYGQQLDNPCGSVVFAYHNQSEAGNAYTAGRILLDVTDSSGQENTDPNATNLKYTLTLDTGDVSTGQEYVVTY